MLAGVRLTLLHLQASLGAEMNPGPCACEAGALTPHPCSESFHKAGIAIHISCGDSEEEMGRILTALLVKSAGITVELRACR